MITTGKVSDASSPPTLTVAVTRVVAVGFCGVKVKATLWSWWQKKFPLYEKVSTPPRSKGLEPVLPRLSVVFRLKSCELYVRVIDPPCPHAGADAGCSTVTVRAAGVCTLSDVTGALAELSQPQPPNVESLRTLGWSVDAEGLGARAPALVG
jgi:hypothetical protein